MIETEAYAFIRKCKQQGLSMRKTSEMLGMSRRTVKRYWDGAHIPGERRAYPSAVTSQSKQIIMEALRNYFEENQGMSSGKQTINAKTAWETLRETYNVGESTVRRYVRELKATNPKAFIPLSFEPGEVMQVDWCEVKICLRGHIWKVPVFCAVLPYSYAIFAMVLPDMKTPCFMEGHVKAFESFGGVPQRVFYDNLKTAVGSGTGKNAVKQERFKMMEAHYSFEAVFMNAEAGNEKGAVENLCGLIRQVAFTPIPKGDSLREIQEHVERKCLDYIRFHKIKDRKHPIVDMYDEERPCLNLLPVKPFDAYTATEAVVGTDLTFRFESTKYSLPMEYVGKTVTVHAFPYRLDVWYRGMLICSHNRTFIKGEDQYLPEHYLPLLEMRPRAAGNAAPIKYGVLPRELDTFRKTCAAKDKYAQLAGILMIGRNTDAQSLLQAVDYANKTGIPTIDKVRAFLSWQNASDNVPINDTVTVIRQTLDRYDLLLGKDDSNE
jgi:transposase